MNSSPVDLICNFQFTEASKPHGDKSFPYRGLSQTSRNGTNPQEREKRERSIVPVTDKNSEQGLREGRWSCVCVAASTVKNNQMAARE